MKKKILFYGTPEFAAICLQKLLDEKFNIIGVVTMPDKKQGRGNKYVFSHVKKLALEHKLEVLQPINLKSDEFNSQLIRLNPDVQVVVAFRMLPERVWSFPQLGTYNVHASLLPDYRGAAPINWALINGEKKTGVTTFKLKHEIDTGDLALQEEIEILDNDNFATLYIKLANLGAKLITNTLLSLFSGTLKLKSQNLHAIVNDAPKIKKEHLVLSPGKCRDVLNVIRAFSPYPGAKLKGRKIEFMKIIDADLYRIDESEINFNEFMVNKDYDIEVYFSKKAILLKCQDGYIEVLKLQVPNKRAMSSQEAINGAVL